MLADRGRGAGGLGGEVGGLEEVAAVEGDVAEGGEGGGVAGGSGEGLPEQAGGLDVLAAEAGILGRLDQLGRVEGRRSVVARRCGGRGLWWWFGRGRRLAGWWRGSRVSSSRK